MTTQDTAQESAEQKGEVIQEKYWDAVEARDIAKKLIDAGNFNFPTNTPILYVFVDKAKKFWGKCQLVSGVNQFASGYQYTIQFNHEAWENLTELQREALVYHELLHIFYDSEKDKYSIDDHDVEEFGKVIHKYGLWRDEVREFMDEGLRVITLNERTVSDDVAQVKG